MKYGIGYWNAGEGKWIEFTRDNAHDAFIDLIDIMDNVSNSQINLWIERD